MKKMPHHGKNGSRHVGRLRIEAAKILSRLFSETIDPADIIVATGGARTNRTCDVYRFELLSRSQTVGSWLTLTDFVRESRKLGGCHISGNELYPGLQK